MKSHSWGQLSRILLCILFGFVVVSALQTLRNGGFLIGTDLADMVPSDSSNATRQAAVNAASQTAEQSIIVVLESSDSEQLNQAVALLDQELSTMGDWLHHQNQAQLEDLLIAKMSAFRFHLLSADDHDVLLEGDLDVVLEQALSDLYSPSGNLRLLPLKQDPFNFFSHYLEEAIARASFASKASTASESDASDLVNREVVTLRLKTAISELQEQAVLHDFFKQLDTVLVADFPEVKVLRTGVLFFANDAATAAKRDINFISFGSGIGMSILILLIFRSVRPLLTAAVSILAGVGFAFAVIHQLYGSVHVFTIVFGASLIGIVIDYSIHYHYHCLTANKDQENHSQLHRALFISLITSIAGFSAMLFSNVSMLQTIAIFSICGITAAWLTVLALAPKDLSGSMKVRQQLMDSIVNVTGRFCGKLIDRIDGRLLILLLCVLLGSAVLLGKGQDDPRRFVKLSDDLLQQSTEIRTIINDIEPGRFFIVEADAEQPLFDRLDELYASVGTQTRLVSVRDWLPSPSEQQSNYLVQDSLFQEVGPIDQLFAATGGARDWLMMLRDDYRQAADKPLTSQQFFEILETQLSPMVLSIEDPAKGTTSLAAFVLLGTGSDLENIRLKTNAIHGVTYIDTVADSTKQLRAQRQSSMWILLLAYIVVGSLMWLLYRDRRAFLMISVPAVSTILTLCTLLLMGQALTLFHTMALFLILGLGMDYVVFLNEMTINHKITRQAIVLSGLTSMLSFGLLSMSSVPVAQGFGLTILIGNSYNLIATLGLAESRKWQPETPT